MKVIIAGSRDLDDYSLISDAVRRSGFVTSEVVCGMARGVDLTGKHWADLRHIPVKPFHAAWRRADGSTNRGAGHERNRRMGLYADALVAVWDGKSPGTKGMIEFMRQLGKPLYVHFNYEADDDEI